MVFIVPQDTPRISVGQGVQMEHTGEPAVHDILWLLQTVPLDLACLVVRPDVVILELERGGSRLSYDATRARFLSFHVFFCTAENIILCTYFYAVFRCLVGVLLQCKDF